MSQKGEVRKAIVDAIISHKARPSFELALGKMIIAFSDAEAELHGVLVHYSGVSYEVGRALFSGERVDGMVAAISSIMENTNAPEDRRSDLEHVLPHFVAINTMRNHIIHYVSNSFSYKDDPTKRIVADKRKSKIGKAVIHEVGPEMLEVMTHDLYAIANHLNMHYGPRTGPFRPWQEIGQAVVPTPWTYKSPSPIDNQETSPSAPRKSQGQPKPSRKK